jgi:hypothetical protein
MSEMTSTDVASVTFGFYLVKKEKCLSKTHVYDEGRFQKSFLYSQQNSFHLLNHVFYVCSNYEELLFLYVRESFCSEM